MTSQAGSNYDSTRAYDAGRGRLLLVAAVCLLALAAAAAPRFFEGQASSAEPRLVINATSCLVNVCPGSSQGGKTHLSAEGYKPSCSAPYQWSVDGGSFKGVGSEIVWDLNGTKPGVGGKFYTATLTAACGGGRAVSARKRVFVWDCPQPPPPPHRAECPTVMLRCPARIKAGESTRFSATVGNRRGVDPILDWTLSAGKIDGGQGTDSILVDPKGAEGRTIRVTFDVKGYDRPCGASCETKVSPTPSPTPTTTPTPVPDCPTVKVHCPARAKAGERVRFSATVGNRRGVDPILNWTLSAGEIAEGQGTDSILVDARGAAGGAVRATLDVKGYDRPCSASCETKVSPTPSPSPTPTTTPTPVPGCPTVTLDCPALVKAGERARFSATLDGRRGVNPVFDWTLSAGEIAEGQGTDSILVDPKGAEGGALSVTLAVKGYDRPCGASCETKVSPTPSPSPSPSPSPCDCAQTVYVQPDYTRSCWFWVLLLLILVGLLALAYSIGKRSKGRTSGSSYSP